MLGAALAAWVLSVAAPERATYLFELDGVPVGTVELTLNAGGVYTYRSTQLFTREAHQARVVRSASFYVDARGCIVAGTGKATAPKPSTEAAPCEAAPEALWLWRRPAAGCVAGREELEGRPETLCADEAVPVVEDVATATRSRVRGTIDGKAFRAQYGAEARLLRLELAGARFTRVKDGHRVSAPPDLFSRGFPIGGRREGALVLMPEPRREPKASVPAPILEPLSATAARELAGRVRRSFERVEPGLSDLSESAEPGARVGSCVAHARRFLRWAAHDGKPRAELVLGLLELDGRAFPHAWVRVRTPEGLPLAVDPTNGGEVDERRYVELGEAFGEGLLELLRGTARIVRR